MREKSKYSKYDRASISPETGCDDDDNDDSTSNDSDRRYRHDRRKRYKEEYDSYREYSRRERGRDGSPLAKRIRETPKEYIREKPKISNCIGVFGMSEGTTKEQVHDIFAKFGRIEKISIVMDTQSGRSRGFGFIYYSNVPDAKDARDQCNGIEIDGKRVRVDYSITQRAHTPTPGVYRGRFTRAREHFLNRHSTTYRGQYTSSRSPGRRYHRQ